MDSILLFVFSLFLELPSDLILVEIFFMCRENICHIVKSPPNVPWKILKLATEVALKAVSSLEGAGVFAVELFLTADGQVVYRYFIHIEYVF